MSSRVSSPAGLPERVDHREFLLGRREQRVDRMAEIGVDRIGVKRVSIASPTLTPRASCAALICASPAAAI